MGVKSSGKGVGEEGEEGEEGDDDRIGCVDTAMRRGLGGFVKEQGHAVSSSALGLNRYE